MRADNLTRRSVLGRAASAMAVAIGSPFISWLDALSPAGTRAGALRSVLNSLYRTVAAELEEAETLNVAACNPCLRSVADLDVSRLSRLLPGLDSTRAVGPAEVRRRIEEQIRSDFVAEDVVLIDGWVVSHTEALLLGWATQAYVAGSRT